GGQYEEPEQQRARLAAPEGRQVVGEGQLTAGVLRDVGEREVAGAEGVEEDEGGDGDGDEGADQPVARRLVQAPAGAVGGEAAGEGRVQGGAESDAEGGAGGVGQAGSP